MRKSTTRKQKAVMPPIAVVAIGDELLHNRLDTNSHAIQTSLLGQGIETQTRTVVKDTVKAIATTLKFLMKEHRMIICCGGLGPTQDDLTRQAIAQVSKRPLHFHHATYQGIIRRFKKRGLVIPISNKQQALFPHQAVILKNQFGTAPGFLVMTATHTIAALPGPPNECLPMLEKELLPKMKRTLFRSATPMLRQTIRTTGIPESKLQEQIGPLLERHPEVQLGFLLDEPGEILIKLGLSYKPRQQAQAILRTAVADVRKALGQAVADAHGRSLPETIGRLLLKKKQTIAVAESCTGGSIAQRIVSVPGSSEYFLEGAVTYSNQAKQKRLHVSAASLKKYGAVSAEIAKAMAQGMRRKSGATWTLSVTGIAGPGGGSKQKPVGLVYLGIAGPKGFCAAKQLHLVGDREMIQRWSASRGLDWLRRCLLEQ
jgi:competence/damage-inducible protein CinA-like protein